MAALTVQELNDLELASYFFDDQEIPVLLKKIHDFQDILQKKTKNSEPATIQEFLLVMNNFPMYFKQGFLAEGWKKSPHYKNVIASEDKQKFFSVSKKIEEEIKNFSPQGRMEKVDEMLYRNLYQAYLLMRKYTKEGDIELYR